MVLERRIKLLGPQATLETLAKAIPAKRGNFAKSTLRALQGPVPGINEKIKNGDTLLHIAASNYDADIVQLLLQNGALPIVQNANGFTPLHVAINNRDDEIVQVLLASMDLAAIQMANDQDKTALDMAKQKGQSSIAQSIRNRVNELSESSESTDKAFNDFTIAVYNNEVKKVKSILEENYNRAILLVNKKYGNYNTTLLHKAAIFDYEEIAELLLDYGADPNATADNGMTLLHFAVGMNSQEVAMMLMEDKEIRIDMQNKVGNTPLHIAFLSDNFSLADIIIDFASSKDLARVIDMQNDAGKTPERIAEPKVPDLHAEMMGKVKK